MAKEESKPTKAFVSYSWTTPEHEMRVIAWAERLRGDGIDVVLDKWDLREGQDKYAFMEQMVTNADIAKVVVFSDAAYATKADNRKGGVGTESQIISKEVYDKVEQQKFIPVVCEYLDGKPCLPTFLASRIYIDFSSAQRVNEEWEKLLRAILNRPLFRKPPLGRPPSHIFDDAAVASRSKSKLLAFQDALLTDKASFRGLLGDFLAAFLEGFEDYRVDLSKRERPHQEILLENIGKFHPARDEFVDFALLLAGYRTEQDLYDRVGDFFESALRYIGPESVEIPQFKIWTDNYRFLIYELFLYYVATLLKHRRLQHVNSLFSRHFLYPPSARMPQDATQAFTVFRPHIESLGQDPAALLKQRATLRQLPFDEILQADVVLFLGAMLYETGGWPWYPRTLALASYGHTCELFVRATSKQAFEHVKVLFAVKSKEDFIAKHKAGLASKVHNWQVFNTSRFSLDGMLNLERLATTP